MTTDQIKNCPQCGGILPASTDQCPGCRLKNLVNDPTVVSPAETGDTRIPAKLISSACGPERIGPYEIVRKLGEGGMGAVYEARQPALDRCVALKVMSNRLSADPSFRQRFEREAKAAASITHPNLVHVYDFGEADGHRFIAMELVGGGSVGSRLKELGVLPPAEAIATVAAAAEALQAAREAGVIHRDIKPDNLLIDKQGRVRVADLGLARQVNVNSGVTLAGMVLGSPCYMAPEQAADASSADHRADIYSLGITLYTLLTGKRPFTGSTALEVIDAHLHDPVPKLVDSGISLPPPIDETIAGMTAKEPAHRLPDYPTLLAALAKCRESLLPAEAGSPARLPESSATNATGSQTLHQSQSHRRSPTTRSNRDLIATSLACGVLLAVTYFGLEYAKRSRPAPPESVAPATKAVRIPDPIAAPEPSGTTLTNLPRDHQSIFERYQSVDVNRRWLPYRAGRPPRMPTMDGGFEENQKKTDEYAAENPKDIMGIVGHYRAALFAEPIPANRKILEAKMNVWVERETAAFEVKFLEFEARMIPLAAAGKYREAYEVWADFPPDYPFPRFLGIVWAAIATHIPEAELRKLLANQDQDQ